MFAFSFLLSSCKEQEHYESKNLSIKSVFDNMSLDDDKKNTNNISVKDKDKQESKKIEEKKEDDEDNNENEKNNDEQKEEKFILKDVVNMRSTPEIADNVVRQLDVGTEIKILEKNIGSDKKWMKIEYNNEIYYMSMEILN